MYFCCNFCNFDLIKWTLGYELKTVCIFNIAFATLFQKNLYIFTKTLQSLQKNFTFFKNTLHFSKKVYIFTKNFTIFTKKLYIF